VHPNGFVRQPCSHCYVAWGTTARPAEQAWSGPRSGAVTESEFADAGPDRAGMTRTTFARARMRFLELSASDG